MKDIALNGIRLAKLLGYERAGDMLGRVRVISNTQGENIVTRLKASGKDATIGSGAANFLFVCDISEDDLEKISDKLTDYGRKGLVACPLEKPLSYWRERIPSQFDLIHDDLQSWITTTRGDYLLKIMVISPSVFPVSVKARYAGIERLVALFVAELASRGYLVTVAAPTGSTFDSGLMKAGLINWIDTGTAQLGRFEEDAAYYMYRDYLPQQHVIHDFSHQHLAMRRHKLPGIAQIWHDPFIMQPPVPTYNVAALSNWQANRFRETTKQEIRTLDVICADAKFYEPYYQHGLQNRRPVFAALGKLGVTKGSLEVAQLCSLASVGLDIIGGQGAGDDPAYIQSVKAYENSDPVKPITYWGEVSEEAKANLLCTSNGILYAPNFGSGKGEAHSHKAVDAACCGIGSIILDRGAFGEVLEDSCILVNDLHEMVKKMPDLAKMDREKVRNWAVRRYDVENVVGRFIPVYEEVKSWVSW